MLTSSVNVIIQLLILNTCKLLLHIIYTQSIPGLYPVTQSKIDTVTGLPLTTLLHLIRNYTQELDINHYITLD
jgi:hypothetical protein